VTDRALVTGASGLLGRTLCRQLADAGWAVTAVTHHRAVDGYDTIGSDTDVHRWVDDHRPTVVFHLAAQVSSHITPNGLDAALEANVGLGLRVIDAAAAYCPIVVAGTMWQHVEARPYKPASLYAAMKQAQLDLARFYGDAGATIAHVELTDLYGAPSDRPRLIDLLHDASRSGTTVEMTGGDQLVDLVHVADAARGLRRAALVAPAGLSTWSISSGLPITVKALVATARRAWGRPIEVRFGAKPYRRYEMFTPWTVHPGVPGFAPTIELLDGLRALEALPTTTSSEEHHGSRHVHHR
jgi:nucleoside-diphosphate-sugar epimerase